MGTETRIAAIIFTWENGKGQAINICYEELEVGNHGQSTLPLGLGALIPPLPSPSNLTQKPDNLPSLWGWGWHAQRNLCPTPPRGHLRWSFVSHLLAYWFPNLPILSSNHHIQSFYGVGAMPDPRTPRQVRAGRSGGTTLQPSSQQEDTPGETSQRR